MTAGGDFNLYIYNNIPRAPAIKSPRPPAATLPSTRTFPALFLSPLAPYGSSKALYRIIVRISYYYIIFYCRRRCLRRERSIMVAVTVLYCYRRRHRGTVFRARSDASYMGFYVCARTPYD